MNKQNNLDDIFGHDIETPDLDLSGIMNRGLNDSASPNISEPDISDEIEETIEDEVIIENIDTTEESKDFVEEIIEEEETFTEEILDTDLDEEVYETEDTTEDNTEDTPEENVSDEEIEETVVEENELDIVVDEDGTISTSINEEVISDKDLQDTPEEKIYDTKAIIDTPEYLKKSLLFGKSKLNIKSENATSVISILKRMKKSGEYLDIYLPLSNIAIRIYEFNNDVFVQSLLEHIYSLSVDGSLLDTVHGLTASRKLLNKIRENCEFLCKDSDIANSTISFDSLAKVDIEYILLGTAALLTYVQNKKESWSHTFNVSCPLCKATVDVDLDLLDEFKNHYKHLSLEDIQNKIDNYSIDETFMEKISKSELSKKYLTKYQKQDTIIKVVVSNPRYGAYKTAEDQGFGYLLNKYSRLVSMYTKNIPAFNLYHNVRKIGLFMRNIDNNILGMEDSDDIVKDFVMDYALFQYLPYVDRVEISIGNNGKSNVVIFDEETMETKFSILESLPVEVKEKLTERIVKINNAVDNTVKITRECPQCNHKHTDAVSAIEFFFFVMKRITEQQN